LQEFSNYRIKISALCPGPDFRNLNHLNLIQA
jgi:hypothetical protein